MRKVISTLVVLSLALLTLAGCQSGPTIAKIGLGHITSISKSTDLTVDKDGNVVPPVAQVDTVIAAVAFDKNGKVVKVTIDTAQTKVNFDKDLQITSDIKAEGKTKVELGDQYGMAKASSIKKEWYQQIAELEKWMVGKTVDQIKAMKTKQRDAAHPAVPDVPELTSLVTITVQDYIAAVEEAYKNAVEVPKGAATLGLGHIVKTDKSVGYSKTDTAETLPVAQVNTTMAAVAFDKNGKVVRALIDTAQTKVQYDKDGKVTSDKTAPVKTKKELGDQYGMAKASSIKKEWYQQIAELEKWMTGKTIEQIKAMKTKQRDAAHPAVPDVPELTSLVTITVEDYLAAVAEAYQKAK
ncbi:MAG: hypothetical protein IMF26_10715 [Candidatus Fermentithermobacillus carboniphilus]|uniref:Lipoprotein n=1 Tax=Candidatus Fermentithermobacillus carboniphilus TaxID=3085328 RepID=A0AAT9LE99_9FIRM|nr:MAG: hypothetical protein IMF26_10715 [Candidatus Fermentithermobacillus carboniphilus]